MIAETEAKLGRLRITQAKKDASSNPAVASMLVLLEGLRKEIREARKGLGDGPQSFNASIAKHEAWIDKVEAKRADAEEVLDSAEYRKLTIEAEIASVVEELSVRDGFVSETPNQKVNYAQ